MTRQRLRVLFNRYSSGTLSPAERAEFFHAIAQAKHDPELKELIDELWFSIPDQEDANELAHLFQKLTFANDQPKVKSFQPWLKIAASVSAVLLCAAAFYLRIDSSNENPLPVSSSIASTPQSSFIRLPDGSTAVINSGSHLTFAPSFDAESTRTVTLEGEAFFDIKHDPSKPFIVVAGGVTTTVLGTAFNVKAFPNDHEVTVTVSRGKVEVSSDKAVVGVLTRDQQLTIKNGKPAKNQHVNAREVSVWMEADISFDNTTLKDAVDELADRFQGQINLLDPNAYDCRFTGSFAKGESLEQILLVICEFNHVELLKTGAGIFEIRGSGCNGMSH